MENLSLEHELAQKLTIVENAARQIATIREHLRTNTDQARKDVNSKICQQMLLLRERQEELINELDLITSDRERALEHHQLSLYKLLWECKQAQRNLKEGTGSNSETADLLSRLGQVQILDRDWAHVSFESDTIGLRSTLLSFGRIRTMSKRSNTNKFNIGESLPMEIGEHVDEAIMAHKSVLRKKSSSGNTNNSSKQQVESVRKWLKKIPSGLTSLDLDISSIMSEFDIVKNSTLSESESSGSTSSFELLTQDSANISVSTPLKEVLSAEFLNTLRQPLSSWLRVIPKGEMSSEVKPLSAVGKPVCAMKRPHSSADEKHYEFEDVINSVRASSNDRWVLRPDGIKKPCIEVTCHKEEASTSEQECDAQIMPSFNENEFLEQLSNLFLCKMKSSPQNTKDNPSAYEIDLSTVLGWKRVLEKIEQSSSFWLQDKKP